MATESIINKARGVDNALQQIAEREILSFFLCEKNIIRKLKSKHKFCVYSLDTDSGGRGFQFFFL